MTGPVLGLLFGLGLLLVVLGPRRRAVPSDRRSPRARTAEVLARAGVRGISPGQVHGLMALAGLAAFVSAAGVSRSAPVALAFAVPAAWSPMAVLRRRARHRTADLRELWPDVVDHLASAVRAGLSLPDALGALGTRGPEPLREPFRRFADDYRATGRFADCLDALRDALADPVADRVVETLRLAREVGGSDLGRLLRTLSQFLRDEARVRTELETRQGWTVNAARLALGAPWAVLALMAMRPEAVAAYNTPAGVVVLLGGAAVSVAAYRIMLRIGRLPEPQRVAR